MIMTNLHAQFYMEIERENGIQATVCQTNMLETIDLSVFGSANLRLFLDRIIFS